MGVACRLRRPSADGPQIAFFRAILLTFPCFIPSFCLLLPGFYLDFTLIFIVFSLVRPLLQRRRRRCETMLHFVSKSGKNEESRARNDEFCVLKMMNLSGERVLWVGISALLDQKPGLKVAIYTGDDVTPKEILQNVENRCCFSLVFGLVFGVVLASFWHFLALFCTF